MQTVTVWGEVLFAIDFSIDFCALYFARRLLGRTVSGRRTVFGAALCAAVGVALVSAGFPALWEMLLCILTAAIAYRMTEPEHLMPGQLLNGVLLFVFLEAAAGGLMTAVFSMLNRWFSGAGITLSDNGTRRMLFWLSVGGLCILFSVIFRILGGRDCKIRECTVGIRFGDRHIRYPCIGDTGNLLREPISGLPVLVMPQTSLTELGISADALSAGQIPHSRLVSAKTISGENTLYWAIHPPEIRVYMTDSVHLKDVGHPEDVVQSEDAVLKSPEVSSGKRIDGYVIFSPNTDGKGILPVSLLNL